MGVVGRIQKMCGSSSFRTIVPYLKLFVIKNFFKQCSSLDVLE